MPDAETPSHDHIQKLADAVSMSVLEIESDTGHLIPAFLLANMMSPHLWAWREQKSAFDPSGKLLSTRRRLNELQRFMHRYTFLTLEGRPGGDPWGLIDFDEEGQRLGEEFVQNIRQEYHETFQVLQNENPDSQFGNILNEPYYQQGKFPRLKNETFEVMNAFEHLPELEGKRAGKCIGLTMLWAAAACVWGRFPLKSISIVGNRAHMFAFINEEEGHLLNNTKWFNSTRIGNQSELSEFVRHVTTNTATSFVYSPGIGMCQCSAGRSTLPKEVCSGIGSRLSEFVAKPVRLGPHLSVDYLEPDHILPNPLAFRSAQDYAAHIHQFSRCKAGSVYEYAVYAFRSLHVERPEVYATAALRDPNTKELAKDVHTLDQALQIVRDIPGTESIFGNPTTSATAAISGSDSKMPERIAMPDEVLVFQAASTAERALLLYTLLQHASLGDGCTVGIGDSHAYVRHADKWIDAETLRELENPPTDLLFEFNLEGSHFANAISLTGS